MPTLFSGIHLALRTLLAHQAAIQVVEHNVSNANTPGYHRQEAVMVAGRPQPTPGLQSQGFGQGQMGSGVVIERVKRYKLDLVDASFRKELAERGYWSSMHTRLSQVEAALAENSDSGLAARLDAFWAGWRALSSNPDDPVTRQDLLDRTHSLAAAFNQRAAKLHSLREESNTTISGLVDEINNNSQEIARLNTEIVRVLASGDQPNDLLDRRDLLVERLAAIGGAVSTEQENGQVSVSIGGHVLVVGSTTFALEAARPAAGGALYQVAWEDGQAYSAGRGELAGLLQVRDAAIPGELDRLDKLAAALIDAVNNQHRKGFGLDDLPGQDFLQGMDALSIGLSAAITGPDKIAAASAALSPGDGSNALEMAGLESAATLPGETLALGQAYPAQVAAFGLQIRRAKENSAAHQLVIDSLDEQREAEAGVSLDEEAANLIKYQRTYQAAARLMTAIDEMIDLVINGMGRVGR